MSAARRTRHPAGFTLLEVLIALSILLIGLVGILILIPQALDTGMRAQSQAASAVLLTNVDASLSLGFSRSDPAASPRRVRFFVEDALDAITLPDSGERKFPRDDDDADDADEWVPSARAGTDVYPARIAASAGVSEASDASGLLSFDLAVSPLTAPERGLPADADGRPRAYVAKVRIYRAFQQGRANEPIATGEFLYEYPR